jgi:hypothetical protein
LGDERDHHHPNDYLASGLGCEQEAIFELLLCYVQYAILYPTIELLLLLLLLLMMC